ncbi:MAG: rod shape-determining protein MreC [Nitrospirae bacterium]|nr:rod shape-determining protein MreC [Nitrospirota bacterium]
MSGKKALLIIVVVASLILMTYQSKKGHFFSTGTGFSAILDTVHRAATILSGSLSRPYRMLVLREEENTALKKRLSELAMERDGYLDAVNENKRLRELLKFRENSRNFVAAARVIARGAGHWEHTLKLDKGRDDGIEKDMTVVTPRGLAGKIISASGSFSTMLWISDIKFSAAVRIKDSRKEGVLSGSGSRVCTLKYVPYEEEIKTGDVVVTSGLDSLFPAGIQVGYVSRVDNKGLGGNFQLIEVTPYQDPYKMEEVIIVR